MSSETMQGLTSAEAAKLLARYGPNDLVPRKRRGRVFAWLLKPFLDPMAVLLIVAGSTYLFLGDVADAAVTLAALAPITIVTLVLEARAERALERLKDLTSPTARVFRDGQLRTIPSEGVVPGDVIAVQEGDIIPADGALLEGERLMVDESALTGESQPVVKNVDGAQADREVYAGTTLLSGRGLAEITATGLRNRYGQIGALVAQIQPPPTPLQRLVRRLVGQLSVLAGIFCIGVIGIELARGAGWGEAIIGGVSLAIAAIPEEFPMVYTLYLTLGAWRLSRSRALVRRLPGVETLGATSVICTDKTGTLTQGRVEVAAMVPSESAAERELLEAAVLASEPRPFDPMERALERFARVQGIDVDSLNTAQMVQDYPFDPAGKYMSHVRRVNGATGIYAKGSLEGMLAKSAAMPAATQAAEKANEALASDGMRVLAVARGELAESIGEREADERSLSYLGLIAFSDPPREGVSEALRECREAGIRVVMITGDHPLTAHAVAEALRIPHDNERPVATGDEIDAADDEELRALVSNVSIFARTRPEQKYRLVKALRAQGHIVAMTGDGVNDAPALREADIGVAMGERGTEVARGAATMVLLDDNFSTIVRAVRNGRRIFGNLQRAFSYLIAFHIPLLLAALVVPLVGSPLLLLPIHLVLLEIIVHPTASLVFEAEPAPRDVMRRGPRRTGEGIVSLHDALRPLLSGISLTAGVLVLYFWWLSHRPSVEEARGVALATLVLGQSLLVLTERSRVLPAWKILSVRNRVLPVVLGMTMSGLLAVLYIPPLARLLSLAPFAGVDWLLVVGVASVTAMWTELMKGNFA